MKKRILSIALVIAMLAIAVVGGTLAYFTDTDAQVNTFTYGEVEIDLYEDFNSEKLNLVPSVFLPAYEGAPAGYGTMLNKVEKEVYVENTGTEEAYVRVHIAVPNLKAILSDNNIDVSKLGDYDVINLSRDEHSTVDGIWNWGKAYNDTWGNKVRNTYTTTINNIEHTVYVVTYESIMNSKDITEDAINGVYMHSEVTQPMLNKLEDKLGEDWKPQVYVVAEAVQADGFGMQGNADHSVITLIDNADTNGLAAFQALNTAFGTPGNYNVNFTAGSKGATTVEMTAMNGK